MTTEITERERGLVEGSLLSPFNNPINGVVTDFAVDIFINVASGHHLINGNKRWAVVALLYFLEKNNIWLNMETYDLYILAKLAVNNASERKDKEVVKRILITYLSSCIVSDQTEQSIKIESAMFSS